jgi:hypothetical protein
LQQILPEADDSLAGLLLIGESYSAENEGWPVLRGARVALVGIGDIVVA